jgi:dimethylaniline monooxygenase (N-oxide forming)
MAELHNEIIVVGAGFYGIGVAKQYLEIRPDADLVILDGGNSIGGVWSKERIHRNLIADSPVAVFHFSDLAPHDIEELELKQWGDISGAKVHRYLKIYMEQHDLLKRLHLNTRVIRVSRNGSGWKLETNGGTHTCEKLIIACGSFFNPNIPSLDLSKFTGQSMHSKDIGARLDGLLPHVSHVTVVGGNKSAVDAVNAAALAGKQVDWVIRRDGIGPTLLAKRDFGITPFQIKGGRWILNWTPNIHIDGFKSWFLFKTWVGKWMFKAFWFLLTVAVHGDTYTKSENGRLIKPHIKR